MGWKVIFQVVVEIRTGRPLEEKGGFAKIAGGNSANYATSSQNAAAVTAYVEHAIARCIPFQQLKDGIKNPWLMTVSYFHGGVGRLQRSPKHLKDHLGHPLQTGFPSERPTRSFGT